MTGRLYTGTSGFSYPGWTPAFYPPSLPSSRRLAHYSSILDACELNGTYYRRPSLSAIRGWLHATPDLFRFSVKAQRGGAMRALLADPEGGTSWLTEPLTAFGDRLGTVLFRVPEGVTRNDERLGALLAAWPSSIPLTVEFRDPSWQVDEVYDALRRARAVLCTTDLPDEAEPPMIRVTGPFLYLRLRRHAYSPAELAAWAARLVPFLEAGHDAFVFFRHDDVGEGPARALRLRTEVRAAIAEIAGQG
jgi:uncharacterized protein YecE (DUF72 family)